MELSKGWCLDIVHKPRILVVDDEAEMAEFLAQVFQKNGAVTQMAANGSEGLEAVQTFHPDVIVTDLKMPMLRGDEMLVELRGMGFKKPIIILTGFGDDDAALIAMRYDAFDFLNKPTPKEIMLAVVQKALRVERQRVEEELLVKELLEALSASTGQVWKEEDLRKKIAVKMDAQRKEGVFP